MSPQWSPEEALERDVALMGQELGTRYNALHQDLVWLHARWHLFRRLFAASIERTQLLNQTAPLFFMIVRDTFLDDALMQLARLTDSASSCGHDNLSLRALPPLIEEDGFRTEVEQAVTAAVSACAVARDYRNKLIAHRDLTTALLGDDALPGLRDSDIQAALDACADVLNLLCLRYHHAVHGYRVGVAGDGGVENLVHYLEKGIEVEARESAGGGLTGGSS